MRIEVFSAIIFVISRLYGHTTGLKLNTKMKTKSQKIEGTVCSEAKLEHRPAVGFLFNVFE